MPIIPIYTKIKDYYKLNPVLKNNEITFKELDKYENINNSKLKIQDNKNKLSNLCPFIYKRLNNMMLDDKKIKTNLDKLRESIFNLSKEIIEETYKKKVSYSNLI